MRIEPVALSLLVVMLTALAPTAAAAPDAIVLTVQDNDGPATLHWQVLTGPVQADAWIVTRIVDGVELEPVELPGTATSYEHQPVEGAFAYVYSVHYITPTDGPTDGQPSQESNRLILSGWPRCTVIRGIEIFPDCAFPLPFG